MMVLLYIKKSNSDNIELIDSKLSIQRGCY